MKKEIKEEDISAFIDAARELCRIVEARSKFKQIQFCQHLYRTISELMKLASEIPGYADLHNFKKNRKTAHLEWKALYSSLGKKFGIYNRYQEIFDPYDKKDKKPIYGSLSDDIADIYVEAASSF